MPCAVGDGMASKDISSTITQCKTAASAPGKAILFGEHAVVYGKTAVAAAVSDLRIQVDVQSSCGDVLVIDLPDMAGDGQTTFESDVSTLVMRIPFASSTTVDGGLNEAPCVSQEAAAVLSDIFQEYPETSRKAFMAIVFLWRGILGSKARESTVQGLRITAASKGLPIGAGLGSSAALSVATAAALIRMRLWVDGHATLDACKGAASMEHTKLKPPADNWRQCINAWAFAAEKVLHGSPSGLDNTVSCMGGAVLYRRPAGFCTMPCFPVMRVLLTNTRVPRETKLLVAHVRNLMDSMPGPTTRVLEAMEAVSDEFVDCVEKNTQRGGMDVERIGRLMQMAHGLLNSLGVGHSALDAVCHAASNRGYSSKLTGAGGGGCALTLLSAEASTCTLKSELVEGHGGVETGCAENNFDECGIRLLDDFAQLGFDCISTSLGGHGCLWGDVTWDTK